MKRVAAIVIVIISVFNSSLFSEDIILKNGKKYINAQILKISGNSIFIYTQQDTLTINKSEIERIVFQEEKAEEFNDNTGYLDSLPLPVVYDLSGESNFKEITEEPESKTPKDYFGFGGLTMTFMGDVPIIGISIGGVNKYGLGYYIGYKTNISFINRSAIYSDISYSTAKDFYGDAELTTIEGYEEYYCGIQVPIVKNLLSLNMGLGLQEKSVLAKFYDNYGTMGDNGDYFVYKELLSGLCFQIGGVIQIGGVGLGLMYSTGKVNSTIFSMNFYIK